MGREHWLIVGWLSNLLCSPQTHGRWYPVLPRLPKRENNEPELKTCRLFDKVENRSFGWLFPGCELREWGGEGGFWTSLCTGIPGSAILTPDLPLSKFVFESFSAAQLAPLYNGRIRLDQGLYKRFL